MTNTRRAHAARGAQPAVAKNTGSSPLPSSVRQGASALSVASFAQADNGAPLPHADRWLADIGFPHDADVAARMADAVMDGLNAIGSGEPAYALKVAVLTKALAALIAAVPEGSEAQEIVDGMCEAVGGAIGMEARKLRRALAKDQRAHLKASKRAFGRPSDVG